MRALAPLVLIVLSACTGNTSVSTSPPARPTEVASSPQPSVSPTQVAGSPSPTTSATPVAGTPSGVAATLHCRLPVTWAVQTGQTVTTKAGFVAFPEQTLTEDVSAPAHSQFYDRGLSKWLPVGRSAVSTDGKRYAYGEGNAYQGTNGKLHVVDVASGTDTVIYGGAVYSVVEFAADGIYITPAPPEGRSRGLLVENPAGGSPRPINNTIEAAAVGGGFAWGLDFNPADPSPGPGGMQGPVNQVLRFDLQTGASTPWFYRPGSDLWVTGFDAAGHPFVTAGIAPAPSDPSGAPTSELWLVTSPSTSTRIFSGTGLGAPRRLAAVDSYGVWFGAESAGDVWLYAGGSLQKVTTLNVSYFSVAGGCIPY